MNCRSCEGSMVIKVYRFLLNFGCDYKIKGGGGSMLILQLKFFLQDKIIFSSKITSQYFDMNSGDRRILAI